MSRLRTWRVRGPWRTIASYALLSLALGVVLWPALAHAVDVWSSDEEFSYGFLVAPIAIGLVWWRRQELRASMGKGHASGLLLVIGALLLMLASSRTQIHNLAGIAVSPLLLGGGVYLWGWGAGRILAFPCGFLVFGLGLYRGLLNSVGFALQGVTAMGAEVAARGVGLHVIRDGLVLHSGAALPRFDFVVAETCSGMNSLLSLLTLAALWIWVTRASLGGRVAVLSSVLPLVVIANCTRVTLVLLVAAHLGQDAALGFLHGASSLVLFGVSLLGLLVIGRIFGCKVPTLAPLP
jgi:exosortase